MHDMSTHPHPLSRVSNYLRGGINRSDGATWSDPADGHVHKKAGVIGQENMGQKLRT